MVYRIPSVQLMGDILMYVHTCFDHQVSMVNICIHTHMYIHTIHAAIMNNCVSVPTCVSAPCAFLLT